MPPPLHLPLLPFPPLLWWRAAADPVALLDRDALFVKQSPRNRISLVNANGLQRFTVPVHRLSGVKTSQFEVKLVDDGWTRRLLQTLRTCYGSAPYFDHYFESLEAFVMQPWDQLGSFNEASIAWCAEQLGLAAPAIAASLGGQSDAFGGAVWDEPQYIRVFSDRSAFVEGASVLDALFHLGPETARHLMQSSLRRG